MKASVLAPRCGKGAFTTSNGPARRWASLGWERSYPRYPATDEFTIPIGRRNSFQAGYLTLNRSTGQVVDRRC
ncbi:hypothetical protein BS329_05395 [Amycolatopsis coloradensis]|uniref:Uncharacterized protein n=1 Tax=Amycolatopsis coloradensis TaxID=76021 RepID=A0A1R0L0U1_9PSEU|nr:hypothetical protein BS329_05395 [Amycolatopsis coloradensis]